MENNGKSILGIIGLVIGCIGLFFLKNLPGIGANIFKLIVGAGILCIIGIIALVIAVIVSSKGTKGDGRESSLKMEVTELIREREQQRAHVKSSLLVMNNERKMNLSKLNGIQSRMDYYDKLAKDSLLKGSEQEARNAIEEKQKLQKDLAHYQQMEQCYAQNVAQLEQVLGNLESDLSSMKERMEDAMMKERLTEMKQKTNTYNEMINQIAENKGNVEGLKNLEQKVQYDADYTDALNELNQKSMSELERKYDEMAANSSGSASTGMVRTAMSNGVANDLARTAMGNGVSETSANSNSVDEELERLKRTQQ